MQNVYSGRLDSLQARGRIWLRRCCAAFNCLLRRGFTLPTSMLATTLGMPSWLLRMPGARTCTATRNGVRIEFDGCQRRNDLQVLGLLLGAAQGRQGLKTQEETAEQAVAADSTFRSFAAGGIEALC